MKGFLTKFSMKELMKFCIGGGSAVIVDFIVYMLFKQYLDVSIAKVISFVAGAVVGFIINKLWTFESKTFKTGEIMKYVILYVCSATANTLVNKGVLTLADWTFLAFLCATGTSTVMNFLGQKFFVFKKGEV